MATKLVKTDTPGIYKRGSRWVFRYRDADGIQRWESCGTERLAKAAKAKRTTQAADGIRPETKITLHTYAREWIKNYPGRTKRGFRESTRDEYSRQLEQYALTFWDARGLLKDVRSDDVNRFVAWLVNEQKRPLSDATIARIMAPFKAMMSTAYEDELIVRNPVTKVILPNRDAEKIIEDEDRVKAMSRVELVRFLDAVDPRWQTFFRFLAVTGVRISEAVALEWKHVQLTGSRPHVKIRQALVKGTLAAPKSRAGRRDIPLPQDVVLALVEARRTSEWPRDTDPVFPSMTGTPLSDFNIRRRVLEPAADAADVPWIGFHTFRHTCASELYSQGRNPKQVSAFLGHSDPGFTVRTYVHLMDEGVGEPLEIQGAHKSAHTPHSAQPSSRNPETVDLQADSD